MERVAWTVMTSAFVAFCILAVTIPFVGWRYLSTDELAQQVSVTLISGTVFVTRPGVPFQGVSDTMNNLEEGARIDSDPNSQGAINFLTSDNKTTLGNMQLYGNARVRLVSMRSPRFEWANPQPHAITVDLQKGRARVNLNLNVTRGILFRIRANGTLIELNRTGSYSIEVTDQTVDVIVREGAAKVTAKDETVPLDSGQRVVVRTGTPPERATTGERNLLLSGDFATPLTNDWITYKDRFDPNDADGKIEQLTEGNRNILSLYRAGFNWGRVGIQQKINREVRDYRYLRLHLALRVSKQNLRGCGQYGSECPLMAKIEYTDVAGNKREWVQGFFFFADPTNALPMRCITCAASTTSHIRVQQDVWYLYDSPDLINLFRTAGFNPSIINTISIYAEGHSFESLVSEVELLAAD
jgi:hypothetical protein